MGLLAALAAFASRPVLLDLAFDFGAGSDDGLAMPHGVFCVIRFIATSLVSDGKWSYGVDRVGAGGSDASAGLRLRRFSAWNVFPNCSLWVLSIPSRGAGSAFAGPYPVVDRPLPLPASAANLAI